MPDRTCSNCGHTSLQHDLSIFGDGPCLACHCTRWRPNLPPSQSPPVRKRYHKHGPRPGKGLPSSIPA